MQDIIQNGISALVVPQKNANLLAEKISLLINDDNLRQSLGQQGRQCVLEKFDWEIITGQYKELIHSVIK
jgi:glycosyltransferase involved in cell wall biosynthesis